MLATTCPRWRTRQLSDRTVFQWSLNERVATSESRVQEHEVTDKQGRLIASGGWCAMKSLGNDAKVYSMNLPRIVNTTVVYQFLFWYS